MRPPLVRQPTHAGSWYTDDGESGPRRSYLREAHAAVAAAERERACGAASKLSSQLDGFLAAAEVDTSRARALIVPHAGYSYSGPTAAYGYKAFDPRTLCVPAPRPAGARGPLPRRRAPRRLTRRCPQHARVPAWPLAPLVHAPVCAFASCGLPHAAGRHRNRPAKCVPIVVPGSRLAGRAEARPTQYMRSCV